MFRDEAQNGPERSRRRAGAALSPRIGGGPSREGKVDARGVRIVPLKVVKFSIGTGTNTGLESFRMIYWAGFIGTTSSVMRNPIDIDRTHGRAICREIGERLQQYLRAEAELPASMRKQVHRLQELEGESPSIVPDMEQGFRNEPRKVVSRGDRSRFAWRWPIVLQTKAPARL